MSQNSAMPFGAGNDPALTTCLNCHSPMPRELRFCRNCGFRLGEGTAEYTETVRFSDKHQGVFAGDRPNASTTPFVGEFSASGAIAPTAHGQLKKRKKMSGMTWMFLGLLVFFIVAAAFTAIVTPIRNAGNIGISAPPPVPRSYVGVDEFSDSEGGGVTFANVEPPGSPADLAGMVGGDIITSFDGQTINDEDQIGELLANTPTGKTVDVIYTRDGESKTTKLTTITKNEFDNLARAFRNRPEGRGFLGFDGGGERVEVPNTKLFGVRLDGVMANRPADLAGIKTGDVVIEFNDIPIRTPDELTMRIRRAIPKSTVKVVVMREGQRLEIPVVMGKG